MASLKSTAARGRTKAKATHESTHESHEVQNASETDNGSLVESPELLTKNTPNTEVGSPSPTQNGESGNGTPDPVLNANPKAGRSPSRRRAASGEEAVKPLTGRALLQKLKECAHLPIREQARQCGYLSRTKSAGGAHEKANLVDFYQAQVEARGHILEPKTHRDRRGREPANRVTVHKNGQIVIGVAYTQMMGLKPGDEFEIKLGYKHIRLNQLDGGDAVG